MRALRASKHALRLVDPCGRISINYVQNQPTTSFSVQTREMFSEQPSSWKPFFGDAFRLETEIVQVPPAFKSCEESSETSKAHKNWEKSKLIFSSHVTTKNQKPLRSGCCWKWSGRCGHCPLTMWVQGTSIRTPASCRQQNSCCSKHVSSPLGGLSCLASQPNSRKALIGSLSL